MKRPIACTLAAALMLAMAAPANAASYSERFAARVSSAGIDTASEQGTQIMLRRIRTAALRACGDRYDKRPLLQNFRVRECARDAASRSSAAMTYTSH